jgi:hypothetical protein
MRHLIKYYESAGQPGPLFRMATEAEMDDHFDLFEERPGAFEAMSIGEARAILEAMRGFSPISHEYMNLLYTSKYRLLHVGRLNNQLTGVPPEGKGYFINRKDRQQRRDTSDLVLSLVKVVSEDKCTSCNGTGKQKCRCDGKCRYCFGTGVVGCDECEGSAGLVKGVWVSVVKDPDDWYLVTANLFYDQLNPEHVRDPWTTKTVMYVCDSLAGVRQMAATADFTHLGG